MSLAYVDDNQNELHTAIIRHVAEQGFAPSIVALHQELAWSEFDVRSVLARIADIRGAILKPNSSDVRAIHPFTLMPTPTWIEADNGDYLEPTWRRKSRDEAQQLFRSLGLTAQFWRR